MKIFAFFAAILATAFSLQAAATPLETFCPHFSTNMPIIWQATTNQLLKSFWIYKRLPPRPFSSTVISNAVVLASLQSKRFPKPSINDFSLWEDKGPNYPGPIPVYFIISPKSATISYGLPHPGTNTMDIPADKILIQRAWADAAKLGVNPAQVAFKEMTSRFNHDESYNDLTNQLCGRGVFLSRKLDGILFWSNGTEDDDIGGFWIEFGSHGQIRAFSLVWLDLKRSELQSVASPQQIIACIRVFKTMSLPNGNETNYFERLKSLAKAKKLTITKIMPCYDGEGVYGETPPNDEPSPTIAPFAKLEAIADFGNSNVVVQLLSPIISSDVNRLLKAK